MAQVRIRKRGKIFSYIFEAGKKDDGKRKVIEKGGFATKKLAYDAGVAAYNDWKHGNIGIVSENITLKDFFQNWLDNVLALNIKPTSLQCYLSYYKRHILPSLGSIPVQELTPAKLDSWIRNLQKGGYSKNTISQLHALIHHAFVYISGKGYFSSTLKTQSSNRYILIDDFLVSELKHWKNQQAENKKLAGDSFVYVYQNSENKIIQQSKGAGNVDAERIFPLCTNSDGQMVFKHSLAKIFANEGIIPIHSATFTPQL